MSDLIKYENNELAIAMSGSIDELARPFCRDIFLIRSYVAGTAYVTDIKKRIRGIKENDELYLKREPSNPADKRAILVLNKKGEKIGYVPRRDNTVLASLMDGGKHLFGIVTDVDSDEYDDAVFIDMDLYLKDY